MTKYNPSSMVAPAGPYSQGCDVPANARLLYVAGQIGLRPDGSIASDLEGQADQAWRNVLAVLADAGMGVEHLIKVNHYLTDSRNIAAYGTVRTRYLGDARPASTLVVVQALAQPGWLVEVEAVAAKA
jgi:2-iminobutanoate/2-iminopropanoate deaminase